MRCALCGSESEVEVGQCGTCGASIPDANVEHDAIVDSSPRGGQPWFMSFFSEKMLISLCVLMVMGMIAATAYAFANSGANELPVTLGTTTIQSSPSGAQTIGAPVPYSYFALPLVECATTYPNPVEIPLTMPATIEEDVPTSLTNDLAVYTDGQGVMKILGPTGWTCSASISEDGGSTLDVYPAFERNNASDEFATPLGNLPPGSTDREIYARQTSACVSCTEAMACPVFTAAANDMARHMGWSCPAVAPTGETLKVLTSSATEIIDPPGIVGDAYPSGGANSVYAVMTYRLHDVNGGWEESCLLPASDVNVCEASLNNFFAHYGTK
jgi:hypothetical protein